MLLISQRASAHLNLRMARPENIKKKSVKTKKGGERQKNKRGERHISKGFNRLDSERRFILGKYCLEFTSVALNHKARRNSELSVRVRCEFPPWRMNLCLKRIRFYCRKDFGKGKRSKEQKSHMMWWHVSLQWLRFFTPPATAILRTFHRHISMSSHKILKVKRK